MKESANLRETHILKNKTKNSITLLQEVRLINKIIIKNICHECFQKLLKLYARSQLKLFTLLSCDPLVSHDNTAPFSVIYLIWTFTTMKWSWFIINKCL